MEKKTSWGFADAVLLGIVFALAFCPVSGVLYFGLLIPMTVVSAKGLFLPLVFAIGTAIPVIIFAWIFAYTVSGIGVAYKRIKSIEVWFRRIIAFLFIGIGIYYIVRVFL